MAQERLYLFIILDPMDGQVSEERVVSGRDLEETHRELDSCPSHCEYRWYEIVPNGDHSEGVRRAEEREHLNEEVRRSWNTEKRLTQMQLDGARYRDIYPQIRREQKIRYWLEKRLNELAELDTTQDPHS